MSTKDEGFGDSYTFSVIDPNGFSGLDCLRQGINESPKDFWARVKSHSELLKLEDFKPQPARGGYSGGFSGKTQGTAQNGANSTGDDGIPVYCPLHPTELMTKKNGKFGPFYSHKDETSPSGYCNGKEKKTSFRAY